MIKLKFIAVDFLRPHMSLITDGTSTSLST